MNRADSGSGTSRAPWRRRSVWAILGGLVLVAMAVGAIAFGPDVGAVKGNGPVEQRGGRTVESLINDTSPALRDMPMIPPTRGDTIREMPEPRGERQLVLRGGPNRPIQDAVTQRWFSISPDLETPSPVANFDGLGNVDGVLPPDTNGDVGPSHFFQVVNSSFQIFNKTGGSLLGPASISTIWQGFGGPCATRNDGDPIVLYDSIADRWLVSQFTAVNPFGECVAISTSPDPTGAYFRYFFQFSTTVFYDYPHLGVWPDAYYMAANKFTGNTFSGGAVIALRRDAMLAGQTATFREFSLANEGALLPSDLDGATLPPAGEPNTYATMFDLGTINVYKFHVDWTTPANATLTGPTAVVVPTFTQLCPSTRGCVDQPSTTVNLDGLGDRLMHRLAYRNFGDHESLVVNHSVDQIAGAAVQAAVRWYEFRNVSGTPTLFQTGTYVPDATNRWMGSVAMDRDGNMALGYSVSSATVFPGIRYTGRLATDPLGQMPQGETTLIAGSGAQTHTASRWGDYAMMTIDPSDDCTFWLTTEYMPTTGSAPWQTRIGSFRFPSCGTGGGPTATPTATATPGPPTATPTVTPTRTATPVLPTATPTTTPNPGCNPAVITIPDSGAGSPYPSNVVISGMTGTVSKVTVDLKGVAHTFPDDIDILLVGPGGQNAIVMSDAGGSADANGVNLTLDDAAAAALSDAGALVSGTFRPANFETTPDAFPAPAPAPSGGSALSVFNGTNPNGTWRLFVVDDAGVDQGQISGGWCVNITAGGTPPTATPTATVTPTRTPTPIVPTATPTATAIPPTATPTRTPTPIPPPTATPTATAIPPTATPTRTPTATATPGSGGSLCRTPGLAIPDNNATGVTDTLVIASTGSITDLNASLNVTHTWVGDLIFTVRHVDTNKSVTIIDRPGFTGSGFGCSGDNINATLDDEAAAAAETACNNVSGLSGSLRPNNLLSAFDGDNIQGTWTINVSDRAAADTGTLVSWCLVPQ